jgi:hypothetical protein
MRPSIALLIAVTLTQAAACGTAHEHDGSRAPDTARRVSVDLKTSRYGQSQPGYDLDDGPVSDYGRTASGGEANAITTLVERYYALGAQGDGTTACKLTSPTFAATVPADYGQELGSAIPRETVKLLSGAKTCAAVLSLLFEREHRWLTAPATVTSIRLRGKYGYALVGSTTMPASLIEIERERDSWKIDGLLGRPLP